MCFKTFWQTFDYPSLINFLQVPKHQYGHHGLKGENASMQKQSALFRFFCILSSALKMRQTEKVQKKYLLTENACRLKYLFLGVFIFSSCVRENLKAVKNILIELS